MAAFPTLTLQNAGKVALSGGFTTLGQVFAYGEVPAGTHLTANIGGKSVAVQMDVTNTYADGSAKMTVLTLARPDLAAGQSVKALLNTTTAAAGPALDLAKALDGHSFVLDTTGGPAGSQHIDVLAALKTALANGTASFWQKGEFAAQARVSIDVPGSQRMDFDVTGFKDGTLKVVAGMKNDEAMEATGGTASYDYKMTMDGKTVDQGHANQIQYANWTGTYQTGASGAQGTGDASGAYLNVQHDMPHMISTGAVAAYNLDIGVDAAVLAKYGTDANASGFGNPLATNGVTQYMPGTGGRADIGITTAVNAAWIMTQDARAAEYAMGQAETGGAVPWNFWNDAADTVLNTDAYPGLWTDPRGGTGKPGDASSGGLTQQIKAGDAGWSVDGSHAPQLSYVPYVMTGERWLNDQVMSQASGLIMGEWDDARGKGPGDANMANGFQTRGTAWTLRAVEDAKWAAVDGSKEEAYFTKVSNENWAYLVSKIPEWTEIQGEAHGWYMNGWDQPFEIKPWQQDYLASTSIEAARHGNADALTFLNWQSNFLVGRFEQDGNGFNHRDGAAYWLDAGDNGTFFKTWAEIGAATVKAGASNGTGWSSTADGAYGQYVLATLSGIYDLTGNPGAKAAYERLMAEGIPYTTDKALAKDTQYALERPNETHTAIPPQDDASPAPPPVVVVPPPVVVVPPAEQPGTPPPVVTPPADPGKATLVLHVSEQAYNGHAQFTVSIDGKQVGGVYTATASHAAGATQDFTFEGLTNAPHKVEVKFTNDAWGGTAATDRNLHVDGYTFGGVEHDLALLVDKPENNPTFSVEAAPVVVLPPVVTSPVVTPPVVTPPVEQPPVVVVPPVEQPGETPPVVVVPPPVVVVPPVEQPGETPPVVTPPVVVVPPVEQPPVVTPPAEQPAANPIPDALITGGNGADRLSFNHLSNIAVDGGKGKDTIQLGADHENIHVLFQQGEMKGDVVRSFEGGGQEGGDTLHFFGYGEGASVKNLGDGDYQIVGGEAGKADVFTIEGVSNLAASDYVFHA